MNKTKRIFIIGHSGAGKGVLGKAVAEKLGWKYLDADFGMVASIGRSLAEIVGKQGEESFQHCLAEIMSHQCGKENIVVTTDDSIVCSEQNRQLLSSEFTVYVKVSTDIQLERISHNRPLLPVVDYKGFLDKLHHERDNLFEQVATISLSSDDGAVEEHALKVVKAMQK